MLYLLLTDDKNVPSRWPEGSAGNANEALADQKDEQEEGQENYDDPEQVHNPSTPDKIQGSFESLTASEMPHEDPDHPAPLAT